VVATLEVELQERPESDDPLKAKAMHAPGPIYVVSRFPVKGVHASVRWRQLWHDRELRPIWRATQRPVPFVSVEPFDRGFEAPNGSEAVLVDVTWGAALSGDPKLEHPQPLLEYDGSDEYCVFRDDKGWIVGYETSSGS
jgi:hypothetical protein